MSNTEFSSLSTLRDAQQESSFSSSGTSVFTRRRIWRKMFLSMFFFFFSICSVLFFLSSICPYLTPSLSFRSHFSVSVPASYQTRSINLAGHLIWLLSVTRPALKEVGEGKKKTFLVPHRQTDRHTPALLQIGRGFNPAPQKSVPGDCERDQRLRWELSGS